MKLIKILKESVLTEAEDENIINSSDSGKEVLQKVETEAEDNGVTNSIEVAQEISSAADKINADNTVVDLAPEISLGVENKITKVLDFNFKQALKWKEQGRNSRANVMICGLPGSGKTASVYEWASRTKGPDGNLVNIVYVNMKNNDLDAFINGYTAQDKEDPDYTKQLFSKNLDDLEKPNSILFLDEYNRQTEDQIRASVLTLINEHYVVGKGKGGRRYFPNFLFTIAAMNPSVRTDRGAAKINDAEKSRFATWLNSMDSDVDSMKAYLTAQFGYGTKRSTNSLVARELKKEKPNYDYIEEYLRIEDLGRFICDADIFEFDGMDKLEELARRDKTPLNQRSLCTGLEMANGDVDTLKDWVTNQSNFLTKEAPNAPDNTAEILLLILSDYTAPSREELFKDAGITEQKSADSSEEETKQEVDTANTNAAETNDTDIDVENDEEGLEDDDDPDFWTKGTGNSKADMSPSEAQARIQAAMDSWNF